MEKEERRKMNQRERKGVVCGGGGSCHSHLFKPN